MESCEPGPADPPARTLLPLFGRANSRSICEGEKDSRPEGMRARYWTGEAAWPALGSNARGIFPRSGILGDGVAVGTNGPGADAEGASAVPIDIPVPTAVEYIVPDSMITPRSASSAKIAC